MSDGGEVVVRGCVVNIDDFLPHQVFVMCYLVNAVSFLLLTKLDCSMILMSMVVEEFLDFIAVVIVRYFAFPCREFGYCHKF